MSEGEEIERHPLLTRAEQGLAPASAPKAVPLDDDSEPQLNPSDENYKDLGPRNAVFNGPGGFNPYEVAPNEEIVEVGDYEVDDQPCQNHRFNLTFSVFIFAGFVLLFWCYSPALFHSVGANFSIGGEVCYNTGFAPFIILGIMGFFYIAYLIETGCSSTCGYLKDTTHALGVHETIRHVRNRPPVLWFHVECYHYETRVVSSKDSKGNTTTRTETHKVVTYTERDVFRYRAWDDISGELRGLATIHNVTRVKFQKTFAFADERTALSYRASAHDIQSRNRWRDTHMNFSSGMDIDGYLERMLCVRDRSRLHCCMNMGCFCLWSWLFGGYCYRTWFDSKSIKQRYTYVKRVQV